MSKKDLVLEVLKSKLSHSDFILAQKLADTKYENDRVKIKYFQSIIDGYIDFSMEKSQYDDAFLYKLSEKIRLGSKEELLEIIDNLDTSNPKIKDIFKQHRKKIQELRNEVK